MSTEFNNHLERQGTVHDSLQLNGRVKQANHTHLENAPAMLIQAKLPPPDGLKPSNTASGSEIVPILNPYLNPKHPTRWPPEQSLISQACSNGAPKSG